MVSLEAALFVDQRLKAARQEAGSDQEDEGERDLGGHQDGAQAPLATACACLPVAFAKGRGDALIGYL